MRLGAWAAVVLLLTGGPAWAQEQTQVMGTKEDRLFWFIPNYQTVEERRSTPAISAGDKFMIAIKDSFDPFAFPAAGFFAGIAQLQNEYPSWRHGGLTGYENRFFAALADQTVGNMMAEGVFPVLLHQDPRFLRLGSGGFLYRLGYAASRVFITRGDDGTAQFNASEVGGNAVMAIGSNLYTPAQDRGASDTAAKWGIQLGVDMVGSVFSEFWPYLPLGKLRERLLRTGPEGVVEETQIRSVLRALGIEGLLERAGGLDVEKDWGEVFSLGEQQLLAVARVLLAAPQFAFLDRVGTALDAEHVALVLKVLSENAITYIVFKAVADDARYYDATLDIAGDGTWQWKWLRNPHASEVIR